MLNRFRFDPIVIESLVGGRSVLEVPHLHVRNLAQAYEFIRAYGYDLVNEDDRNRLWKYHRRAVTYIRTELLEEGEEFPDVLSDPNKLKDLAYILIYASTKDARENSLQRWACATLKVIHVLVHLENDLFTMFSGEIQDQILKPIQDQIYSDPVVGVSLGRPADSDNIDLKRFETKAFKTSDSAVTKLLAKPEAVAFTILDKIGVRFVTKHLFDVFRVMRFLVDSNLVSFPHNVPDQSNNTLYPANIFLETMESLTRGQKLSLEEVDAFLNKNLKESEERATYLQKLNAFSSKDYQFIKFITRRLIRVQMGDKPFSFFYPFEVQIVDYNTFLKNLQGASSHEEYKKRQKRRARARVLGLGAKGGKRD